MPVLYDSGNGLLDKSVSAAGGTVTFTHNVSTLALDRFAVVLVQWIDNIDVTGGTLTATFGGTSMTAATPIYWNSNKERLQLFTLAAPGTGAKVVVVTMSGLSGTGQCGVLSASYSGVADVGTIVTAGGTSTSVNAVTTPSVLPAYRVITAHGSTNALTGYNQTMRGTLKFGVLSSVPGMILGDAPGDTSVVSTANQNSTALWGAYGVPLSPVTVTGQASLGVSVTTSAGGALYRESDPDPKRYWMIEA